MDLNSALTCDDRMKADTGGKGVKEAGGGDHGARSGFLSGATRGVTVSMSAFPACHQCYCTGSSLAWGLNLRAVVCGIF